MRGTFACQLNVSIWASWIAFKYAPKCESIEYLNFVDLKNKTVFSWKNEIMADMDTIVNGIRVKHNISLPSTILIWIE